MPNKKQWLAISLAYTLFLFYASLTTIKVRIAQNFEHKDKIVHIGIYLIFTILWFAYFNYNRKIVTYKKVILLAFTTGVLIEILQDKLTLNRSAEVFDIIANGIGITIAILLLMQQKIRNTLNLNK